MPCILFSFLIAFRLACASPVSWGRERGSKVSGQGPRTRAAWPTIQVSLKPLPDAASHITTAQSSRNTRIP